MVLNKPAGQTVHPPGGIRTARWPMLPAAGWPRGAAAVFRPVNRLDKGNLRPCAVRDERYAAPLLAAAVQKCTMPWPRGWWTGGGRHRRAHCAGARVPFSGACAAGAAPAARNTGVLARGRRAHTLLRVVPVTGAHTSDPCAFRVPGASAGGRRHVRRMSGAHGAPGAALRRGIVWPDGGGCGAHSARAAARRHACAAGGVRHPGGRFRHLTPSVC